MDLVVVVSHEVNEACDEKERNTRELNEIPVAAIERLIRFPYIRRAPNGF